MIRLRCDAVTGNPPPPEQPPRSRPPTRPHAPTAPRAPADVASPPRPTRPCAAGPPASTRWSSASPRASRCPGWRPLLLLSTGLRTLLADPVRRLPRQARAAERAALGDVHVQPGTDGELWLDYVADLGDGFDATYSVAYLLAQPHLEVDGARAAARPGAGHGRRPGLPDRERRRPTRTAARVRTARPCPCPPPGGPRPTLYALPGNHDWYDGLTAFLRLFARREDGQHRRLAHRAAPVVLRGASCPPNWWLFAIDEQFGAYLDDPQLLYFEQAAKKLGPERPGHPGDAGADLGQGRRPTRRRTTRSTTSSARSSRRPGPRSG